MEGKDSLTPGYGTASTDGWLRKAARAGEENSNRDPDDIAKTCFKLGFDEPFHQQ